MPTLKRKTHGDLDTPESPISDTYDPTILLPLPKRRRWDSLERRIANLSLNTVDSTVGIPEPPPHTLPVEVLSLQPPPAPEWDSTGDVLDTDIVLDDPEVEGR